MGDTLASFGAWFKECKVPTSIMRKFTWQLVVALDFAHSSGVIHTGKPFRSNLVNYRLHTYLTYRLYTASDNNPFLFNHLKLRTLLDIKPDNIFLKFLDKSGIESEYLVHEVIPQHDPTEAQYTPILSCPLRLSYFGGSFVRRVNDFNIALGDWGVSSSTAKHLTENIQPVALWAPEVLIKAPWDARAVFWNLGAVLFEVYRAIRVFSGRARPDSRYELREHLAEIVDMLGPFPKDLLKKVDSRVVKNIFNEEGKVGLEHPVGSPPVESEAFLPNLDPETREVFASFLRYIMKINPADRPTPDEMVEHPWLTPGRVLNGLERT